MILSTDGYEGVSPYGRRSVVPKADAQACEYVNDHVDAAADQNADGTAELRFEQSQFLQRNTRTTAAGNRAVDDRIAALFKHGRIVAFERVDATYGAAQLIAQIAFAQVVDEDSIEIDDAASHDTADH